MLLLTSTSDIVRVVTGSAGDIRVHASYVDNASGTITPARTNTPAITTATTTTVVASPAASTQRNVKGIYIENASSSVSNAISVEHFDGTTAIPLFSVTLLPGENMILDAEGDWIHHYANGAIYAGTPPGTLIQQTVLTAGTTFTTTANTTKIRIRGVGAGGGGGGANTAATSAAAAGGGAGGAYADKLFTVSPSTGYTYAIGAAGTAGAAAAGTGGTGGSSTFTVGATTVTATGGLGGVGSAAAATALMTLGGAGQTPTNGDLNISGQNGGVGIRQASATVGMASGKGGDSQYGSGGIERVAQNAGANGAGFGSGGSGGCCVNGGAAAAGGAGTAGVWVVEEYT